MATALADNISRLERARRAVTDAQLALVTQEEGTAGHIAWVSLVGVNAALTLALRQATDLSEIERAVR